jgi:hypothetical protein
MSVPASSETPPTAVIFIGTKGAGKKTLLSQLDWSYGSSVDFVEGAFTIQEASEQTVTLDGKKLILMNTPGPYGIDEKATKANTENLTKALQQGYNYKIFIILKGNHLGLTNEDLALMSTVNKCVRQVNGAKVEFGLIINQIQIQDDSMYNTYKQNFTRESLRKLFRSPKLGRYELDIEFNSVLLGRRDERTVLTRRLRRAISKPFKDLTSVKVAHGMSGFATVNTTVAVVVIGAIIAVCRK